MIFTYFKSTVENIRERIKNPFTERNTTPFAGAFVIALVIYNWHLFFSLVNFDNSETRISKIQIISNYLKEENWKARIGYPIIIAFGSIIFFYVFNNISLGITTLFNRWFKSFILHLFDRSQTIPRDEWQRTMGKMNRLRISYEDLKRTFSESQHELEEHKAQLSNKDAKLLELSSRNIELATEKEKIAIDSKNSFDKLKAFEDSNKGLKILYAQYGRKDITKEVTDIVTGHLNNDKMFLVENQVLGGDPVRYLQKELLILYSVDSKITTLSAKEHYRVEIESSKGLLVAHETEKSRSIYSLALQPKNSKAMSELFPGKWQLEYTGKLNGKEEFEIKEGNKYFAKANIDTSFKHYFTIENIYINNIENKIHFTKVAVSPKNRSIDNEIAIIELGKRYEGKEENGEVTVKYRRLD